MVLLSEAEVEAGLRALPEWRRVGQAIERGFRFGDFAAAMAFVNRVAEAAEAADHHPDIAINYNRVTMALSTHSEGGITQKDIDMASRVDAAL